MTRDAIRADALLERAEEVWILNDNDRVVRVTHAQIESDGRVFIKFADSGEMLVKPDVSLPRATQAEAQEHEDERDRLRVADKLRALGDRIVRDRLPVPVSLARVTVGFDLDDEQDLSGWAKALGRDPVRPDFPFDPVIESTEFGVTVQLLGGRREDVEHRDSVGAFPVVEAVGDDPRGLLGDVGHRCESPAKCWSDPECPVYSSRSGDKPKPGAWDGWPVSDGHRPTVSDDAMQHDGRYDNGRAEA